MSSSTSLPKNSQTQTKLKIEEQQQQAVNPMIKILLENLEYEKILLPSLAESVKFNPIKLNNYQKQTYLFNIINNINSPEEQDEDIRVWVLALYTIVKMNTKPSSILFCPFLINFIQLLNKLTELIEKFKIQDKEININWFIKERSLLLFLSDRGSEFDKWSVASSIRRLQSQNNQFNHLKTLTEINSLRNPLLEKFLQLPSELNNININNNIEEEEDNLIELPGPSEILNGELNFLDYNLPIYNISWDSSIGGYEEAIPTDAIISNWNLLYSEPSSDRKTEVFLAELYKPTAQNRLIPYLTQNPLTYDQLVGFCKFNFLLAVEYCKLSQKHSFNLNIESLITSQPTISSPLLNLILELTTQNFIKFSESYLKKFLLNCKDQAKSTKDREEISEINRFVDSLLTSDWLLEQFCGDKSSLEKFISSVGY